MYGEIMTDEEIVNKINELYSIIHTKDKEIEKLNKRLINIKKKLLLGFDTQETILKVLSDLEDINTNGWR